MFDHFTKGRVLGSWTHGLPSTSSKVRYLKCITQNMFFHSALFFAFHVPLAASGSSHSSEPGAGRDGPCRFRSWVSVTPLLAWMRWHSAPRDSSVGRLQGEGERAVAAWCLGTFGTGADDDERTRSVSRGLARQANKSLLWVPWEAGAVD